MGVVLRCRLELHSAVRFVPFSDARHLSAFIIRNSRDARDALEIFAKSSCVGFHLQVLSSIPVYLREEESDGNRVLHTLLRHLHDSHCTAVSRRSFLTVCSGALCHAVKNVRATSAGKGSAFSCWLRVSHR